MTIVKFKLTNNDKKWSPERKTAEAAAFDLKARIDKELKIVPGEIVKIPTGVFMELEPGYAGLILPRSGLALKWGLTVINSPGLIDSDYRGEIEVCLIRQNIITRTGYDSPETVKTDILISPEARIAQLLIIKLPDLTTKLVRELSETERGTGGFGSTGV